MSLACLPFAKTWGWHVLLLALVPVPLGHLMSGHADLLGDLEFQRITPDRVLSEIGFEKVNLNLILAHAFTLSPVFLHDDLDVFFIDLIHLVTLIIFE